MTNQKYQEAVDWLFVQAPNYQIDGEKAYKPGLENITRLCDFFGNPQEKIKCIHIGGTNGKGSTSNMLASVLQESGYKIGLFNSPHLIDFTERIKINGENCDKEFVFQFIQKLKTLPEDILPSFFEFTTIMAFEYFHQKNVDFAIIEVGLGGRLDSTNIIKPLVSAITNVQLDHQNILGNSIEEIAFEKAGIIKNKVPIISGEENEAIKNIIKRKAEKENTKFVDATPIISDLNSDLKGNYQKKNIRVVLAIIEELKQLDLKISDADLERGLSSVHKNTGFIGRWFEFSQNPLTICDTAHNQAGLEQVFSQLNLIAKHKHVVLGFVNDKKIDDVMALLPENSEFYFAKPSINRGRHPEEYEDLLLNAKIIYKIFDSVQEAYLSAKQEATQEEMVFIGGSNFVVGEFLEKNLTDKE
ncbi:bifunctional folylpolyglutamate synthase/dihydrofolate synthase [Chryseobacterium wangxinyae]|uniref:bifunctional folylpolyglutamate synthase/dihydrofolate synthase n=1 Tax=Chryseobacterium sp. CY350 TaxID=2997336 RepID=UPI00226FA385|nr:folylpolyglutamate synthase/dihydrofolate synthase family protein [Chryseobacterium sp. CY350]MCY0976051.1 bifunctional folylpolyglutamate synthase/dihydrofolate synthase [Chryseobacterium sp. CY350]WBZ94347.1 bifunctional folylpolyglutamate synthase/dihydrofolate synthase [Chryseobacterium sp. CY350]